MHDQADAAALIIGVFFLYFLPPIVAAIRKRTSQTAIGIATLFFGWTILGWVICLIWAFTGESNTAGAAKAKA